jgi:hypothetical protein
MLVDKVQNIFIIIKNINNNMRVIIDVYIGFLVFLTTFQHNLHAYKAIWALVAAKPYGRMCFTRQAMTPDRYMYELSPVLAGPCLKYYVHCQIELHIEINTTIYQLKNINLIYLPF